MGNSAIALFDLKKICLLIFIWLSAAPFVSAQSPGYYWAGDTKYYFEIDSTELLIEVNVADSRDVAAFRTDTDVKFSRTRNRNAVQFGVTANARRNFISKHGLRAGQVVSYPMIRVVGSEGGAYVTDEITVKFNVEPDMRSFMARHGLVLIEKLPYGAYLFRVSDRTQTVQVANRIKETERVVWSNPNFVQIIEFMQADPLYNLQYHLHNTGQTGGSNNIDINAPEAWAITTGCNIRVAVIDDGVEGHPDLNPRVVQGFSVNSGGGGAPANNAASHGQQCAGIIAASHNTIGGRGVAPNALIVPVNLAGVISAAELGTAINWAWRPDGGNADVLSNSWSTTFVTADLVNEIYNARLFGRGGRGAVVVFASGNSNTQFSGVNFPANLNGVVTVGAINKSGSIWDYSSRGPEMDLVAPSGNLDNNGDIVTTDRAGAAGVNTAAGAAGDNSTTFGGTSAACPQVAGVAALILSVNPTLSEIDVRNILNNTATDMGTAGFDNTYGFGRVNAFAAVQAARISISGPATICSSSNITLGNIPLGASGTWSAWPASYVTTSSGTFTSLTGSATISLTPAAGNQSGSVTLTVTTNTACGTPISATKTFWIGIPHLDGTFNGQLLAFSWVTPPSGNDIILYNDLCTSVMGSTNMTVGGASGGTWSRMSANPSNLSWSTSGNNISFYFYGSNQSSRFRFTASNSCGTTTKDYYFRSITCSPGGGGGCDQYSVSPNPARSVVSIVVPHIPPPCNIGVSSSNDSRAVSDQQNNATIRSIKLIDANGYETFSRSVPDVKAFDLDVSKLKKGVYLLIVSDGNTTEQHRIIVE